jgi:cellobionic acid phosphorylase
MRWLFEKRDERGLNYIQQGDWNDPMNMVGYKGKGVSGWLTLATAYGSKLWADALEQLDLLQQLDLSEEVDEFRANAKACNSAVNKHIWSDKWYGRGITDDGVLFGIAKDHEGRIFLNPQSWAILSGAASAQQQASLIDAVEQQLETPYGVEMLAPAYTKMREDIGRVTQKWPGVAENGSIYNHASAFYVYALYQIQHADRAFRLLRQMLPSEDQADIRQRGQLPVFIPNYYRGAYRQFGRTAGRSSQLFNTGTVHWFYRCLVDGLFGVQGCTKGLRISPQLPSDWPSAKITREFRGATFTISILRNSADDETQSETLIEVDGKPLASNVIENIEAGKQVMVTVYLGNR